MARIIAKEAGLDILAMVAVGLVAAFHVGFMILEMFLWRKPFGRKIFGLSAEFAEASASLAANQGLYNGFLAAGLIWGLLSATDGYAITVFFLACVIVAGIFGAVTVRASIFWIQSLPALLALAAVWLAAG